MANYNLYIIMVAVIVVIVALFLANGCTITCSTT